MKTVYRAILTTLAAGALFASTAISAPIGVDDWINISRTDNWSGAGGEFKITKKGETDFTWISFCLEKQEFIDPRTTDPVAYKVESIEDFATLGGINLDSSETGKDSLSKGTKWLMNAYINDFKAFNGWGITEKSNNFASIVQNTIWYFEDEINSLSSQSLTFARQVAGLFTNDDVNDIDYFTNAKSSDATYMTWVKAINLVDSKNLAMQSQVVANPVPEPATMLLFGAGLAGLAGLARRRKQAS